jgi:hypothetical protein
MKIWAITGIAGLGFIIFCILAFIDLTSAEIVAGEKVQFFKRLSVWFMISSEVLFLALLNKLQKTKKELIIKKFNGNSKDRSSLIRIKRKWITDNTGLLPQNFFETAEKFEKIRILYIAKKSSYENYWYSFSKKLFSESSKPRILSLIVFLMSICFLILMKGTNDSSLIIELIQPENFKDFLVFVALGTFMLFLFIEAMVGLLNLIRVSFTAMTIHFDNNRSESDEVIRIFIKDLIILNRLDTKVTLKTKKTLNL